MAALVGVLVCRLGHALYGLDLAQINRVIPMCRIVPVPGCGQIDGALLLDGCALPVLDLHRLTGLARPAPDLGQQLVMLNSGIVLWAGEVEGVANGLTLQDAPPDLLATQGVAGTAATPWGTALVLSGQGLTLLAAGSGELLQALAIVEGDRDDAR